MPGGPTYRILRREFLCLPGEVAVLAGPGNNGGDGFVVARYLASAGLPVAVFLLGAPGPGESGCPGQPGDSGPPGDCGGRGPHRGGSDPAIHRLAKASLIVDALLGTGLNSPVQGLLAALIERVNHLRAKVLAVDIPGLSADTGEVLGVALRPRLR